MKHIKRLFALSLLLAFSLTLVKPVNAQTVGIGVFPPILQIEAEPPANVNAKITVQNQTDQTTTYEILLKPFKASPKGNGEPLYQDSLDPVYKKFFEKIEIVDGDKKIVELTLAPKQKKDLVLHAGLLKGEQMGEYYFSILFVSKQASELPKQSSLGSRAGIAINVLFQVGPKSPARGFIKEFSAPGFLTKGPVPFKINVLNSGQSYTNVKGNILIKNMFGQSVGEIELTPVNILASSDRLLPSKESANSESPLTLWNEKFLLGFYKADLTISMSDSGPILKKEIGFSAFPIEGILGIIISLGFVVWIIRRIQSKRQL